jgi:dTDP-4-amino-4,6-dideoxy-D-galactose acyltransferase
MYNLLETMEWDSDFFGYPVCKINASEINAETLKEIIGQAKNKGTRLIYLFANSADNVSNKAAQLNAARLVDQKITFHIKIDTSVVSATDMHIEQYELNYPNSQLISLSLQSGLYSRYKIDKEFKNNEFEKLYLAWIENSVNKKIADYTLVYREDGVELGFVTIKIRDSYGEIGLIAVDERSRGKAIGTKLTSAVINLLHQKNIPDLHVATQIQNIDACNFYKKMGFTGSKAENIYHIWL